MRSQQAFCRALPGPRAPRLVWVLAVFLLAACGSASEPVLAEPEPARAIELEPPEDRQRSPHTGWTRAHYEAVFARLILGFIDHRSDAGARTRYLGGEHLPATMEGAVRMLPALGAWLACPCNPERIVVEGREIDVGALARDIVLHGTDPRSRDYWHGIGKGWDQRKVEAATLAEFLVRSRERVWDRFDALEQGLIMSWLRSADEPLAANWLAFQIARNTARVAFDRPIDAKALRDQLDLLERDYEGDGFYRDGAAHRFDWYNAFVIHPQLTFWRTAIEHEGDAARVERVAERTRAFLGHLPYLMDREGRVPPIGRSLAYRSAVLSALQASVLAGDGFVEPGLARRMSSANLRYHVEAGMFAPDHTLTRGYHGEQPRVLENYLRPGSQYFVTHGLAVLALPPTHPFWAADELPLPADLGDFVHALPAIGWMVEHERDGAGLTLHNVRSSTRKAAYHDRYKKLSYAALTWFAGPSSEEERRPYDAQVVSAGQGRFDRRRSGAQSWAVAPGFAWLRYGMTPERATKPKQLWPHWISTAALGGPTQISTLREGSGSGLQGAIKTGSPGEGPGSGRRGAIKTNPARVSVRLSCIAPSLGVPARLYEGSPAIVSEGGSASGQGDPEGPWWYVDGTHDPDQPGAAALLLAGLEGWTRAGPLLDWPGPAEHVLGGEAVFLGLGVDEPISTPRCFASMSRVSAQAFDPGPLLAAAPEVEFMGSRAKVRWRDGALAWIELARDADERVLEFGPLRLSGPLRMVQVAELEGVVTLVAVGLRSISDVHGALLKAAKPRVMIACEIHEQRLRCEIDGPVRVRSPGPGVASLRWREPLFTGAEPRWSDPIDTDDGGSGWVRIEPSMRETTTSVFELSSREGSM